MWVTPEALAAGHPPRRAGGADRVIMRTSQSKPGTCCAWPSVAPRRQTEGLLRSLATLLGLDIGVPDHTMYSRPRTCRSPRRWRRPRGVHVMIDSTGVTVYGTGEWRIEKHGERGERTWRKLHLAVDPHGGEILASELTSNDEGDTRTSHGPTVMADLSGNRNRQLP
jgi:hypothetical protein